MELQSRKSTYKRYRTYADFYIFAVFCSFFYPDLVAFSFNLPYEMEALTLIDEFKLM